MAPEPTLVSAPQLAIDGGTPVIGHAFEPYQPHGPEELAAVQTAMQAGPLSGFVGAWGDAFFGGPQVRQFEEAWADDFGVQHAVSVNSATSGLIAAVGALGLEPGDEVIVTPWTMSATATAILVWNAIPVFADIEPETFGLDPAAVERLVGPRTRAILVTDIFGHAARMDDLLDVARRHGLRVIEDAAQAPRALDHGRRVGTVADVGVYSFNIHKHIHTGEGGMCVTDDAVLADRMQMIRNHGEAVAGGREVDDLSNLIGFNFRLGEIEAAIGLAQLTKLEGLTRSRQSAAARLSRGLRDLRGLRVPVVREGCSHVYYVYPLLLDVDELGVEREWIVSALRAEGVPAIFGGYQNVHRLPVYEHRIAYGRGGYPWSAGARAELGYGKGACPVAELLHEKTMIGIRMCAHAFDERETTLVVEAFRKVWSALDSR